MGDVVRDDLLGPGPKDIIEKLACEAGEKLFPEKTAAQEVCDKVKEKFKNLPEGMCEAAVEKISEKAESYCPKQSADVILDDLLGPGPKEIIEKLICEAVEERLPEKTAAQEVCDKVKEKFKNLPEGMCEAAVEKIYEKAESYCPKQSSDVVRDDLLGP